MLFITKDIDMQFVQDIYSLFRIGVSVLVLLKYYFINPHVISVL